jgi:aspartyl-tRNA(Asn)/glutamyl-tRNA(Gln) amidotransferase subunit A
MPEMTDLTNLTVKESSDLLKQRKLSSVDLTKAHLDRIAALDPKLHAYLEVFADDALMAAQGADLAIRSGHAVGPFHGVPFALKDIVHVKGRVTTGGSKARAGIKADVTAEIARRLFAAGMVLLGKTHTVEFAFGAWGTNQHMGTPRNPWDMATHRNPGGSSNGSAVAVSSRMAPWAIGTDTGGSVRIPAAFCGITGLKTTVGLIPTDGVLPLSNVLDSIGPLARSVEDAAILFDLLRGQGGPDGAADRSLRQGVKGLVLGALDDRNRAVVAPAVLESYDRSLDKLAALGAEIVVLSSLPDLEPYSDVAYAMMAMETHSFFGALYDDDASPLDEQVRGRVRAGITRFGGSFPQVLREQERLRSLLDAQLDGVDALLTPTVPVTAIPVSEVDTTTINPGYFTRPINLAGRCGLAVPNGFSDGLPTSLQIVGAAGADALVLRIGHAYQAATDWHLRAPNLA